MTVKIILCLRPKNCHLWLKTEKIKLFLHCDKSCCWGGGIHDLQFYVSLGVWLSSVLLSHNPSLRDSVVLYPFVMYIFKMSGNSFFPVLLFILVVCTDVIAESGSCSSTKGPSTMMQLKRTLLCEYDSSVRPVPNNDKKTRVVFFLKPFFYEYVSNICQCKIFRKNAEYIPITFNAWCA